jgi:hypothetical protein
MDISNTTARLYRRHEGLSTNKNFIRFSPLFAGKVFILMTENLTIHWKNIKSKEQISKMLIPTPKAPQSPM